MEELEPLPDPTQISTDGVEELRRKEVAEIARLTEEIEQTTAAGEDSQPDPARLNQLEAQREQARNRLSELS